MIIALLLTFAIASTAQAVRFDAERRRWAWTKLSLEARLREANTRGEVFERSLARLRADAEAGKLTINADYRSLFDRLTADAKGPAPAADAKGPAAATGPAPTA